MQLYAKTDESDVGRIKLGESVTFKVDAYPKDVFRGTVSQKRMNATTIQNVVTYDTVIDFNNDDLRLFPGMTAYVTIPVATAEKSLKVPNTALRFRPAFPAAELRRLYAEYGIDEITRQAPQAGAKTSSGPAPQREVAVVWKVRANKSLEPIAIETGITDHAYTEVVALAKGDLQVGDNIVTASVDSRAQGK
jgi:HlyD family secretion protein